MFCKTPMTMMDFFRKSEGVWFSQRSVHHFDNTNHEFAESNLIIQVIEKHDPRLITVCEQQNIDPNLVAGGACFSWQDNDKDGDPNPNYAAILADIPRTENSRQGKFLRDKGYVEGIPVVGIYHFAEDGVLTIDTEYEKTKDKSAVGL